MCRIFKQILKMFDNFTKQIWNKIFFQVKAELEKKMEAMQEALVSKMWKEMESLIQKTKTEIIENLEEMKIVLVKERYMSKV